MTINYVFTYEFHNINLVKYKIVDYGTSRHYSENKIHLFVRITDIKDVELTNIM